MYNLVHENLFYPYTAFDVILLCIFKFKKIKVYLCSTKYKQQQCVATSTSLPTYNGEIKY